MGFKLLKTVGVVKIDLILLDEQFPDMENVAVSKRLQSARR
jgi:PleD family two-component response regulator